MKKFIVLLVIILLLAQCGFTSNSNTDPSPDPEQLENSTQIIGVWEITMDQYYFTDKIDIDDFMSYTADEGNQYLVIDLTVTNQGKEAETFLPSIYFMDTDLSVKVYYDEDYEFTSSTLLGMSDSLHDTSFNPLLTKSGIIAFMVPESISEDEKPLDLVFSIGDEAISFDLRFTSVTEGTSVTEETFENRDFSS